MGRELAKTRHPMAETTNNYVQGVVIWHFLCHLMLSLRFNFILYVYINLYLRLITCWHRYIVRQCQNHGGFVIHLFFFLPVPGWHSGFPLCVVLTVYRNRIYK